MGLRIYIIHAPSEHNFRIYNSLISASRAFENSLEIVNLTEAVPGRDISNSIEDLILSVDVVIADVTGPTPDSMFEIGIAISGRRQIVFIANGSRDIPYQFLRFQILIYDLENYEFFETKLLRSLSEVFGAKKGDQLPIAVPPVKPKSRVFISYSHSDEKFLVRILVHLRALELHGLIEQWSDQKIKAGENWKEQIEQALDTAKVAILVVSADFLASNFIINHELPKLLEKAESEGTVILPIVVKHCRFARDSELKCFQAINDPAKPLDGQTDNECEKVFDSLSQRIEQLAIDETK